MLLTRGEIPENDRSILDLNEWASVYRTRLAKQAEYRNEIQRRQPYAISLAGLIHVSHRAIHCVITFHIDKLYRMCHLDFYMYKSMRCYYEKLSIKN